ncbi:unnamed protein product [Adineta steineri]|uniref:RDRP core domain-containing protein n=1 Tax=Adineta steineri TaxID=433720 RepID=A0A818PUG1_9BILA|nr:unnamed protein product [Adineta steineri]
MTEDPFTDTAITSTNTFVINPEAHTSLQLLHRRSSEEGTDDDEEEPEPEDDVGEEDDNNVEEEELEEEQDDPILVAELNNAHGNDLLSSPEFSSLPSRPFSTGWGRGVRSISISPPSPSPTTTTPVIVDCVTVKNEYKSELSSVELIKENTENLATTTTTITKKITKITTRTTLPSGRFHTQSHGKESFNETIDFSFNASTTKIVFDNETGYKRALRTLNQFKIPNEPSRHYADIWSFCLHSRTTRLYHLQDYESQKQNSTEELKPPLASISPILLSNPDSQFWLVFQRRPIFNEIKFNIDTESCISPVQPIRNNSVLARIKFFRDTHVSLSYGALTSMNDYYYHPEYTFRKSTEWTILFRSKKIELDRLENFVRHSDDSFTKTFRKSVLPTELIDRAVIFTVHRLGFTVYICTKGNMHEYIRTSYHAESRAQTDRISSKDNDCPIFSTICLHILVKTNRTNRYNNTENKYLALSQVKELFGFLLDFFYSNQILVCFASIKFQRGCLTNIRSSTNNIFTRPIQLYAFSMLRTVGYLIEQKISQLDDFRKSLLRLAGDDDDKFYRLCLYLFRRSTEYHFLNLHNELKEADSEYTIQLDQCNVLKVKMAKILSPPRINFAYVPSIRVTPTTIQIQPLKLVKLHRVIREQSFNDPMSFALVEIRDEANRPLYARDFRSLRDKFKQILTDGIQINKSVYCYLHHSMSQVKEKQFWFLDNRYSLENILSWMGNFDNERIVAKHAARMAQCFTSTEPSIRIPAELVKYIPDVKTNDKQYCFTDGVGTISKALCQKVQKKMGRRFMPSVLQIRYGGCKGTVSVDPNLDDKPHQLVIRHSMLKFKTEHDQLEICKVSSPRALYLNRQDILLLSTRGVPEAHFLVLQNENHLWLVQALLCSSIAFELLNDRVGSTYFNFRDIANAINLVEEPFFLQLLITCGHDCVSKFQQRAKIKTAKNKARNMFGIVDEYGVLEYGEVFIQYNHISDEKLEASEKPTSTPPTVLDKVKVVITKNPCHHPGDLRTFTAVDKIELRHLVDVVVFPQKGPRPHPNEISGSDLDGDEYAVIWDPDLIPTTDNDIPYDYDSADEPVKLDCPIERKHIIEVVLDIAAQNLTGDMSNLHLATADLLDARDLRVCELAGLISQELDAPKTGKHPITSEGLNVYRNEILQGRYPDFMMKERYQSYASDKVIGKLYRSARRAIIRWHKAARTHCSLRHLHSAQIEDDSHNDENLTVNHNSSPSFFNSIQGYSYNDTIRYEPSLTLDPSIQHPLCRSQLRLAKTLYYMYREGLQNIISVFNYQDEIDLFCRCEALDQLVSGKQDINISAGLELQRLIDTIRLRFFHDFDQLSIDPTSKPPHDGICTHERVFDKSEDIRLIRERERERERLCEKCNDIKLARAVACYYICYSYAAKQSTKARSRILSFPWLFSSFIIEIKRQNQKSHDTSTSKYIVIGRAMRNMAKRLMEENQLKLKIYLSDYFDKGCLFIRSIKPTNENSIKREISEQDQQTNSIKLTKILFIEIMNYWIERQKIFDECSTSSDKKPRVRDVCWHQLLICFISKEDISNEDIPDLIPNYEQYKLAFQSKPHILMTERYTKYIQREISTLSADFDNLMHNYCTSLIRLCFQLSRRYQSNEYANLSDYLVLALQSIGIEKELNDIAFDIDN